MPKSEQQLSLPMETLEAIDLPPEARDDVLQALALLLLQVADAESQGERSDDA